MLKAKSTKSKLSSKRSRKTQLMVLAALIVIAVALGAYLLYRQHQNSSVSQAAGSNTSGAPAADNAPNEARKGSSTPAPTLDNGSSAGSTPSFSVQIVSSSVNNGNLHVGTLVSGVTSGSCALTASQAGHPALQLGTSSVKQDVNTYDCGVFNVPTSKFPSSGNWQLTLTVSNNGSQASNKVTVTIPTSG